MERRTVTQILYCIEIAKTKSKTMTLFQNMLTSQNDRSLKKLGARRSCNYLENLAMNLTLRVQIRFRRYSINLPTTNGGHRIHICVEEGLKKHMRFYECTSMHVLKANTGFYWLTLLNRWRVG